MTTLNLTDGNTGIPHRGLDRFFVLEKKIDLSANNSGSSDVLECLNVPAGTFVFDVFVRVITPEGGTLTATVGDGAGADSWDASTNLNATAGTVTHGASGTDAYATSGKFYAAADTIDLTMSANAGDTAVFVVSALCVDLAGSAALS